ncbi:MAG: class I mannose-6-phosphate isomerase [Clostridia bacterium]|nr:class I mannose-6-phosphate isomerase [Clostridia bacterium]
MYPLLLKPVIKNYIWGGSRLIDEYGFETDSSTAAEAWMLTCREKETNTVLNGEYKGRPISDVPWVDARAFPLLVKLIDAKDDLSVQVHPSSLCASLYEGDDEKTEMWYVIDCAGGSSLIFGLNEDYLEKEVRERKERGKTDTTIFGLTEEKIRKGEYDDVLRRVSVAPGDVFFVEPGTVHAIGKGIFLAEVQQNSDTTYRVYDYDRAGQDGRPRELHVEKALDAVRLASDERHLISDTAYFAPYGKVRSIVSDKFSSDIIELDGEYTCRSDVFSSVVILSGDAKATYGGGALGAAKGDSLYIPENCEVTFYGKCLLLVSRPQKTAPKSE